jgi:hypothetical protein
MLDQSEGLITKQMRNIAPSQEPSQFATPLYLRPILARFIHERNKTQI